MLVVVLCALIGMMPGSTKGGSALPDETALTPATATIVMNSSLFGISFPEQNNGWFVGKFGTIVCTTDGGKSWSLQKSGEKLHLYDVSFCDSSNGWAVGENGFIIHTMDGGKRGCRSKAQSPVTCGAFIALIRALPGLSAMKVPC
jgi:photosystem II stability/assembly factor-like uncharacterized protein